MIDPREFVGGKKEQKPEIENEDMAVSGSFVCGECYATINSASLNEDEMILTYVCLDGHINKATI